MYHTVRPSIVREPTPGYRANVAVCVADLASGKVLGFQRCDHCSWQFPQGGIDHGETPAEAAFRELYEETGITAAAVEVLQELKGWVHYDWPKKRQKEKRAMGATNWRGQRQKWFLMKARSVVDVECCVDLSGLGGAHQEFGQFAWFHIEDMLPLCRDFKRGAYAHVIREMQPLITAHQRLKSQVDGLGASNSGDPHQDNMSSPADLTNCEVQGRCTLANAVQENVLARVIAAVVQRHGYNAVKKAVDDFMGSQDGIRCENSRPSMTIMESQHSPEHDYVPEQAHPPSVSHTQADLTISE